ncbi:hypothetical protein CKG00_15030 (plasmid) [Morganella morganii]|uniref:Uncharacterized protein n=1 Tax=Morganella morganii TaxID=582 RepID=A0A433ZQU3_MORMO|nr:hypothetical protein CKG00_15030 [Morganella morganii]
MINHYTTPAPNEKSRRQLSCHWGFIFARIRKHYSTFNESMIYHPQLVGEDYLKQIGAFVDFRAMNVFVI